MPDSKRDTNGNQDAFIELKAAFSSPREAELALKPNQTTRLSQGLEKCNSWWWRALRGSVNANLPLEDVEGNLAQIERLAEAGCELIRIAIPHKRDLNYFEEICQKIGFAP